MTTQPLTPAASAPLELWGGLECTANRVRDAYLRQLDRNGHLARADDVERFASLGVRAFRCPVLWEQHAPNGEDVRGEVDWAWAELARLAAARAGVPAHGVRARPQRALGLAAARPRYAAPGGEERRRAFRPWRYRQAAGWV